MLQHVIWCSGLVRLPCSRFLKSLQTRGSGAVVGTAAAPLSYMSLSCTGRVIRGLGGAGSFLQLCKSPGHMAYVLVDAAQLTQQIDVNFGCFQRNCQADY